MADRAVLRDRAAAPHLLPARRIGPPRRPSRWYSRFVAVLKVALPLAAIALIAVIAGWPQLFPAINRLRQALVAIGIEELAHSRMINPRFRGVDDQGQPFSLAADIATPSASNPDVTELVRPRGDLTRSDGSWIALTADEGSYDRGARKLDLGGRVTVFHDHGYEVETTRMRFDFATSIAEGDAPVTGQGPDTEFQSEGFRIEDRGARVMLTGEARLVLYRQPDEGPLGLPEVSPAAGSGAAAPPAVTTLPVPPGLPDISPTAGSRATAPPAVTTLPVPPAPPDRRRPLP